MYVRITGADMRNRTFDSDSVSLQTTLVCVANGRRRGVDSSGRRMIRSTTGLRKMTPLTCQRVPMGF